MGIVTLAPAGAGGFSWGRACHLSNELRTEKTLRPLIAALRVSDKLTHVNLGGNILGPTGAAEVAEVLLGSRCVTSLDLHRCFIPGTAAQRALSALFRGRLTTLSLAGNPIGPEGAQHIASALAENDTMTLLDLQQSGLGPGGAQHLAEGLGRDSALLSL